jgi:hypothetical protein
VLHCCVPAAAVSAKSAAHPVKSKTATAVFPIS